MNIPDLINIKLLSFPTHYLIFFVLGLITLFIIWLESVRDGFDKERMFDIYFSSLLILIGLHFLVRYLSFYDYHVEQNSGLLVIASFSYITLAGFIYFTLRWKWSVFRILDIFSLMYFVLTSSLFFYKAYQVKESNMYIFAAVYSVLYLVTFIGRNRLFSGVVFSIFLLLTSIFGQIFYTNKPYLIFYFSLITISMLNLVMRSKKNMAHKKLNFEFLSKIRGLLLSKEKRLGMEQQKLIEEDPYLKEGRDTDNAEEIDEAILEDRAKVEIDIKKGNISDMQGQVKKALENMEKGVYGVCEVCGNPIDKARLEIYPEATMCMNCAKIQSESA